MIQEALRIIPEKARPLILRGGATAAGLLLLACGSDKDAQPIAQAGPNNIDVVDQIVQTGIVATISPTLSPTETQLPATEVLPTQTAIPVRVTEVPYSPTARPVIQEQSSSPAEDSIIQLARRTMKTQFAPQNSSELVLVPHPGNTSVVYSSIAFFGGVDFSFASNIGHDGKKLGETIKKTIFVGTDASLVAGVPEFSKYFNVPLDGWIGTRCSSTQVETNYFERTVKNADGSFDHWILYVAINSVTYGVSHLYAGVPPRINC